jgi:hypothetical protein
MTAWEFSAKSFVIFTISVGTGASIIAQSKSTEDSPFLNPKKAPAILELRAEKEQVRNASSKTIVRFALGCVTPVSGKPINIIDMLLAESNANVAPGKTVTDIEPFEDFDLPLNQVCKSRQSKLAVVDVLFSDGTRWNILKTRYWVIPVPFPALRQERMNTYG